MSPSAPVCIWAPCGQRGTSPVTSPLSRCGEHANSSQALRDHLVIGYFVDGKGTPPDAPSHHSGYCVTDVLEECSDWSADEVEETSHASTRGCS